VEQLWEAQLPQLEDEPVPTKRSEPLKAKVDILRSKFSFPHFGQQIFSEDLNTRASKSFSQS